jgi:hypothetical protein
VRKNRFKEGGERREKREMKRTGWMDGLMKIVEKTQPFPLPAMKAGTWLWRNWTRGF